MNDDIEKLKDQIKTNYKAADTIDKKLIILLPIPILLLYLGCLPIIKSFNLLPTIFNYTGIISLTLNICLMTTAFTKRIKNVKLKEDLNQKQQELTKQNSKVIQNNQIKTNNKLYIPITNNQEKEKTKIKIKKIK